MDSNYSPTVAVSDFESGSAGSLVAGVPRDVAGGTAVDAEQQLDAVAALLAEFEALDASDLVVAQRVAGAARSFVRGDWQLGGWSESPVPESPDPFDWLSIAEGPIVLALGTSHGAEEVVALPRILMRWVMRAHLDSHRQRQRLTQRLTNSLESLLGDSKDTTLFCATIAPLDHAVHCASVGHMTALRLHEFGCEPLVGETRPFAGPGLGGRFVFFETRLGPGETLLAASVAGGSRWPWDNHEMFQTLSQHRSCDAADFASLVGQRIVRDVVGPEDLHDGVAVVVAKRAMRHDRVSQ